MEQIPRTPPDTGVDDSLPVPIIAAVEVVDTMLGSGSGSGSGEGDVEAGTCGYRIVSAKLLVWDRANLCWTDGMMIWLFDLNNTDLSVGRRYDAIMVDHELNLDGLVSGSESGSGSGESEKRPLFRVLGGTGGGPSGSGESSWTFQECDPETHETRLTTLTGFFTVESTPWG